MSDGWIKLHRGILRHWVYEQSDSFAVWVGFLLKANHETKTKTMNGSLVTVEKGQFLFGYNAFSERSGVSVNKLRRIVGQLKDDGMISVKTTNRYSIVTINNYERYQTAPKEGTSQPQANHKPDNSPNHKPEYHVNGYTEGFQGGDVDKWNKPNNSPRHSQTHTKPTTSKEVKKKEVKDIDQTGFDRDRAFLEFWTEYPRKVGKAKAEKKYKSKIATEEKHQRVITALKNHKTTDQWKDPQFIPHPTTWLNEERWDDELNTGAAPSAEVIQIASKHGVRDKHDTESVADYERYVKSMTKWGES